MGVFATRPFKAGELIHRMDGRQRSFLGCLVDVVRGRIRIDDPLQLAHNRYLELDDLSIRFNHSCAANAAIRREAELFALTDIRTGDEITFDYSMTVVPSFYSWIWRMRCGCAAPECRQRIGDLNSVSRSRRQQYLAAGALQDYIIDYLDPGHRAKRCASDGLETLTAGNGAPHSGRLDLMVRALDTATPSRETTKSDHSYFLPGGKTGVLLLHGLAGTPKEMREVGDDLARAGYTVICPQLAGHCGTYDDLKATAWQDWAGTAAQALVELRKTCDFVVVGGLSAGAVLSLHLASRMPRLVDGVALLAPTLWLNGWVVPAHAYLFRLVLHRPVANLFDFPDLPPHGIKDPQIRTRVRDALRSGDSSAAGLPVTPGAAVLEHRRMVQDVLKRLKTIEQPTLIVHAREDDYADMNNVSTLARGLPGRVELLTLDDSYHIITTDRQKSLVTEKMIEFIGNLRGRANNLPDERIVQCL